MNDLPFGEMAKAVGVMVFWMLIADFCFIYNGNTAEPWTFIFVPIAGFCVLPRFRTIDKKLRGDVGKFCKAFLIVCVLSFEITLCLAILAKDYLIDDPTTLHSPNTASTLDTRNSQSAGNNVKKAPTL